MKRMKNLLSLIFIITISGFFFSCEKETIPEIEPQDNNAESQSLKSTWETVIGTGTFANQSAFEAAWNYYYPWGRDHNGSARMYGYPSHVNPSGGVLTISSSKITWNEGNSSADPYLPIKYHSGACHAKKQILVNDQYPNYEIKGEFQVPTVKGTWPAFWLSGAWSWPPESDIMEFKGNSTNWQNTFRAWNDVSTTTSYVSGAGNWHQYRVWISKANSSDVNIHYYIDGSWKGMHTANFVGKPMWLIINMQMEGSSGSPGPSYTTTLKAKNVYVGRTKAY
jgi:galactan endo-beta-1,3-galactanase